jgi:hypothetical protein
LFYCRFLYTILNFYCMLNLFKIIKMCCVRGNKLIVYLYHDNELIPTFVWRHNNMCVFSGGGSLSWCYIQSEVFHGVKYHTQWYNMDARYIHVFMCLHILCSFCVLFFFFFYLFYIYFFFFNFLIYWSWYEYNYTVNFFW